VDPDSKRLPPTRPGRSGEHGRQVRARLAVAVSDGRGRPVPDGGLGRWLAAVAPARARGEVAVALVTDAHVRKLNLRYRRKDAPTDVLSFPSSTAGDPRTAPVRARGLSRELGDIVIARGVARRQARQAGHPFQTELRVLALHGLLHLLGFDHHHEKDEGRMARMEARLRRKGGLAAGLIERSRP
jgi:probable rRNA maturation factor